MTLFLKHYYQYLESGELRLTVSIDNMLLEVETKTFLLLEDGNKLLEEEGDSIVQEYQLFTQDTGANNSFFQSEGESIIDFSERNPFSEVDRF